MSFSFKLRSHKNKLLIDHLRGVGELSEEFIKQLDIKNKEKLSKISYLIGISHDFAKATTFFQRKLNEGTQTEKSNHGPLSSVFAFWLIKEFLKKNEDEKYLSIFAWLIVNKHHGDLETLFQQELIDRVKNYSYILEQIKDILKNKSCLMELEEIYKKLSRNLFKIKIEYFLKNYNKILKQLEDDLEDVEEFFDLIKSKQSMEKYLEFLLLYSTLIDADKFDASDVLKEELFKRKIIPENVVDIYKKNFLTFRKKIDGVRERAYNEVLSCLKNANLEKDRIFSINLPTGCGKTLTAFSFALKLRNKIFKKKKILPRIIYCLPFLSIIDQNAKVLFEVLNRPDTLVFLKHHHLADIKYEKKENNEVIEFEEDKALLFIDGWYSEIIITTFVQFFESLITNKNSAIRKVHNIPNSIIILDEFQSIPCEYWKLTEILLKTLSKKWNCYFIIMTATMPMVLSGKDVKPLIKNVDFYFKNENLNRFEIFLDLKRKNLKEFFEEIFNEVVYSSENVMIILNTVRASQDIYLFFKERLSQIVGEPEITEEGIANFSNGINLINLNANVIPLHRLERIEKIKKSNDKQIIISTQLVEAGVDIDVDVVYRDLAPIDSIVQSAGRCNRNGLKSKGKVKVICLLKNNKRFSTKIYGRVSIDLTERILKKYSKIDETDIKNIIQDYFLQIKEIRDISGRGLIESVCNLEFDEIKKFSLIKEQMGNVDICIFIDNSVEEYVKKIMNLKNKLKFIEYENKFKIITDIKKLRRKLEQYIISPFISKNIEEFILDIYNEKLHFCELKPQERDIYKKEVGFFVNKEDDIDLRLF